MNAVRPRDGAGRLLTAIGAVGALTASGLVLSGAPASAAATTLTLGFDSVVQVDEWVPVKARIAHPTEFCYVHISVVDDLDHVVVSDSEIPVDGVAQVPFFAPKTPGKLAAKASHRTADY